MLLSSLLAECNESIRVHYASGHFTRERAMAGLTANGLTDEAAADLLALPVDPALFDHYKTWPADLRPAAA